MENHLKYYFDHSTGTKISKIIKSFVEQRCDVCKGQQNCATVYMSSSNETIKLCHECKRKFETSQCLSCKRYYTGEKILCHFCDIQMHTPCISRTFLFQNIFQNRINYVCHRHGNVSHYDEYYRCIELESIDNHDE